MELLELDALERILELGREHLSVSTLYQAQMGANVSFPVYGITLGSTATDVPVAGFFGGVHGLERIGSEVVMAYLHNLVTRLQWDRVLHHQLEHVRLVFIPIVNPVGMAQGTRANAQGIDLMRNAPVDAAGPVPSLIGGQRISRHLPWFRGIDGEPMAAENQALCTWVETQMLTNPFSIALDCHSGFGLRDRIWFPFAYTRKPIAHLAEVLALRNIFYRSYSHHNYVFEPQSQQYLTHGDVWDHLYMRAVERNKVLLPLTLEMGSWLWVKKNPRQLFSRHGIFNPLIAILHRSAYRQRHCIRAVVSRALARCGWRHRNFSNAAGRGHYDRPGYHLHYLPARQTIIKI